MPSTDRLTSAARDHGKTVINAGTDRLTSAVRGRKKPLLYLGAALALAGAGTAAATTVAESASTPVKVAGAEATVPHTTAPAVPPVVTTHQSAAHLTADRDPVARHTAAAHDATRHDATRHVATTTRRPAAPHTSASHGAAAKAVARKAASKAAAPKPATPKAAAPKPATPKAAAPKPATPVATTPNAVTAHTALPYALPRPTAAWLDGPHAIARRADTRAGGSARSHRADADKHAVTWHQVSSKLNQQTNPTAAAHHQLPPADQLTPVGTAGPQTWMPLNPAQVANASTIVKQTLANKMGVRSAVIAVATAMQESGLVDVNYGTGASLGLFQQQTDMGWGTAAQIMNPRYAADAFLTGLRQYQASNPDWAAQPLWQSAQGVQKSGFPFAYAKWEAQAASLVKQIATHQGSVTS